ncbi:HNH endonuclease signature motif containing protein [Mycobacterium sp. B14F4]|uniref:HNH endonuclease signature motif containing protein n=1 Tax=Mycobacterium sp. B14F4 TaxID=3153565 RepID=UPI00325F6068
MSFERISKRVADMSDDFAELMAESLDSLSTAELLKLTAQWEAFTRRQATLGHRLVANLERAPLAEIGESSAAKALSFMLRIDKDEATRRVKEARDLAPRRTMTGEVLEPALTGTAAAQERGDIGGEHVKVIRLFLKKLPMRVSYDEREAAEAQLAQIACTLTPEELRKAADRLAALLDQDGEYSDVDRANRRYLLIGKQQPDGMSDLRGRLDPQGRAVLESVLAKLGAPGMCNPEDESPCIDGEPSADSVAKDLRSTGQRNHDALTAMGRALLASGALGSHNGLPVTVVITTTLQELESGTGHAVTGGGTLIPMTEVIRQATAAHHYLAVFDKHTEEPLYLGRAKRLATKAQRIVLYAKDRGCTRPGCTAPAYHSQVHHAVADWKDDGQTNITDLTLACGPDNRRVKRGGWRTRKRKDGRTEWLPPPQLDTGQARVNNYHHPQRYLVPHDDTEDPDGRAS